MIIFVGDSILDNAKYAEISVTDYLQEDDYNVICLAEDNSRIRQTFYFQLQELTEEYNLKSTYIFVSIGGNDILKKIVYRNSPSPDALVHIQRDYAMFIQKMKEKIKRANIILLTLYYIPTSHYRKYDHYIKKWNTFIKALAKEHKCRVLDVSKILTEPEDFSHHIEPSTIGGKKLSNEMIKIFQ